VLYNFSGVGGGVNSRGHEVAIFRQTAANSRQMRLWVLKISIFCAQSFNFASKSGKCRIFSHRRCIFGRTFSDNKKMFQQVKI